MTMNLSYFAYADLIGRDGIDLTEQEFTEDPHKQRAMAEFLLQTRFQGKSFVFHAMESRARDEWRNDVLLFIDHADDGKALRDCVAFMFVRYRDRQSNELVHKVAITHASALAMRDVSSKQLLHVISPNRSTLEQLQSARVTRRYENKEDGAASPTIDIERCADDDKLAWFAPEAPHFAPVRFESFVMHDVTHHACAGQLVAWSDFLSAYAQAQAQAQNDLRDSRPDTHSWAIDLYHDTAFRWEDRRRLIFDAIASDEFSEHALGMVGVGPLEDALNDEMLDALEELARTADARTLERMWHVVGTIYVHGESDAIIERWLALTAKLTPGGGRLSSYAEAMRAKIKKD